MREVQECRVSGSFLVVSEHPCSHQHTAAVFLLLSRALSPAPVLLFSLFPLYQSGLLHERLDPSRRQRSSSPTPAGCRPTPSHASSPSVDSPSASGAPPRHCERDHALSWTSASLSSPRYARLRGRPLTVVGSLLLCVSAAATGPSRFVSSPRCCRCEEASPTTDRREGQRSYLPANARSSVKQKCERS